jgi:hypothetical protein
MEDQRKNEAVKPRCFPLLPALLVWGFGVFLPLHAVCGPDDGKKANDAGAPGGKKGRQEAVIKRSLRMDEIEIYGDVEKPKTMFVIPRAGLQYSRKDQEKDFTHEILDPLTKEWVEDTQRWRVAVPPP